MFEINYLNNGIQVITRPMEGVRSFSIGVWVKVGSNDEPIEKLGITHLIEHMFFKGTTKRSAKDIAHEIDAIGGSLNAFTSKDCTAYYTKVLSEDAPIAIDVLADMILNSVFDEEELKKEIKVVKEEIAMYEDSPEDVAYDIFAELTYKNHPLGLPILGTPDTVSQITRDDIISYIHQYYTANNIVISVAGFLPDDLMLVLEQAFGNINRGDYTHTIPMADFQGGYIYSDKDIEQHHLVLGFDGICFNSSDYYAMLLLSNYFGGTSSSRLFQSIREDHGLTYSIYSHPTYFKHGGNLSIYMSYQPENTQDIVPLLIHELNELKLGIDLETLKNVKNQLRGSYILGLEGSSGLMNILGKRAIYDAPLQTMGQILESIDSITLEQVNRLISNLFLSPLALALVGKVEEKDVKELYTTIKEGIFKHEEDKNS